MEQNSTRLGLRGDTTHRIDNRSPVLGQDSHDIASALNNTRSQADTVCVFFLHQQKSP